MPLAIPTGGGGGSTTINPNGSVTVNGTTLPVNTTISNVPPSATDDAANGQQNGNFWYDNVADILYILTDDSAGAAVWEQYPVGSAPTGSVTVPGGVGTGSTFDVANVLYIDQNGALQTLASSTGNNPADGAVNYYEIDGSGSLVSNTTGFTDGNVPMFVITTDGSGVITDVQYFEDLPEPLISSAGASSSGGGFAGMPITEIHANIT